MRTDAAERALPRTVRIVEVGPRDGLQNEPDFVPTDRKLAFVSALRAAGLAHIEAASFVSPKWVPQMADAEAVMAGLAPLAAADDGVVFSALTPNMRGFERAAALPATREVAVFVAASEAFSRRNTNCSRDEALGRFPEQPFLEDLHLVLEARGDGEHRDALQPRIQELMPPRRVNE